MDYWMPKLNGATACRNILAKNPSAHVILVSGWSPPDHARASGALAILPKPVDLDRLNATLHAVACGSQGANFTAGRAEDSECT